VRMADRTCRKTRPGLKSGICGEHGGDRHPSSSHRVGLNYVSCSPFRVLTARLAGGAGCGDRQVES